MDGLYSVCPCHDGETRDSRFTYLDRLIRAGWGSVPMTVIDRAIEQNGGVLPLRADHHTMIEF